MSYPKRIKIQMNWSEEGAKRYRSVMGPNAKLPKYKTITVYSEAEEQRFKRQKGYNNHPNNDEDI
jgi:hypothetical protein